MISDKYKSCTKCGKNKLREEFYFRNKIKGYRVPHCKDCCKSEEEKRKANLRGKEYRKTEKYRKTIKKWSETRQGQRSLLNAKLNYRYGIILENYEFLFEKQNGVCLICRCPETATNTNRLSIDHCHDTGEVRGLLCRECNSGLGKFKDNIELLERAVKYLKKEFKNA